MSEYLDTRDLYAELEELQTRAADDLDIAPDPLDEDEVDRLNALTELFAEIGEDAGRYGETMIPDSEFVGYAQQFADDIADVDTVRWPFTHIDWEAAADDLRMVYTSVSFDGTDYLIRLG